MQDHFTASNDLTKALSSLALFVMALIVFQFFTREIFGGKWNRGEQPRSYWIAMAVQASAFVLLIVLLYLHAG